MYKIVRCDGLFPGEMEGREEVFFDYVKLKALGYSSRYNFNIMPLDQYDFFSTHYILYKMVENLWTPIMVQRFVSRKQCLFYNLPFPIEVMVENCNNESLKDCFRSLLSSDGNGEALYPSGFTTNPKLKYSSIEKELFVELTAAFHFFESRKFGTQTFVTSAVEKFKTSRVLERAGHQFLGSDPRVLKKVFYDEPVLVMGLKKLSSYCEEAYLKRSVLIEQPILKVA